MPLSPDLISQFVKATKDETKPNNESTLRGTVVKYNGKEYVKLDGSELLTPVKTTTSNNDGDRVDVTIKDHTATITGNTTSPSAQDKDVQEIGNKITEFEIVIADKVSVKEFEAEKGRIDNLVSDNIIVKDKLTANEAEINKLIAKDVEISGKLDANEAEIKKLDVEKLSATAADIKYATIENLKATDAEIYNLKGVHGEFEKLTTDKFAANEASIKKLETEKLSATDADIKYANIDFSNIGKAAIEKLFTDSGLIKDLIVGDGTITGELVGVTIKGDLIEGNTIKADKLVVKGSDGLYYKLNVNGEKVEGQQTEYNSLNGSIITAKSITATKIAVDDLVAFDATIGGFNITNKSLYSGVKESVDNTTRGIYLDRDGQMAIGDGNNFLRYYKDQNGVYKLEISANSISMSAGGGSTGGSTLQEELDNIKDHMSKIEDEVTTLLRIESSRGTVFKNDQVATVLSAVIYRGSRRITDMKTLKEVVGPGAYLEWSWQRLNDASYGVISADDKRLGNEGFTFTLSPEDVDTKVTFLCQLIV